MKIMFLLNMFHYGLSPEHEFFGLNLSLKSSEDRQCDCYLFNDHATGYMPVSCVLTFIVSSDCFLLN